MQRTDRRPQHPHRPQTLTEPATPRAVEQLALLRTTAVLAVVLGGYAIVALKGRLLPERFSYDSERIQILARRLISTDDLSYSRPAEFYRAVGLAERPTLAGMLGFTVAVVAVLLVVRKSGLELTTGPIIMIGATILLSAVFLGFYSKDVFVFLPVLAVLLAPPSRRGLVLTIAALVLYAAYFRTYWAIVAAIYLGLLFLMARGWRLRALLAAALAATALAGLAIYIVQALPPDHYREVTNITRANGVDAATMINDFVDYPEPIGGIVNNFLSSLALIAPLPLARLGSGYYLVLAVGIFTIWAVFLTSTRRLARVDYQGDARVRRAVALVLAFAVTQGVFEPDYGAALRHLTPLLPLMLLVAWRAGSEREELSPEGALLSRVV